MGAATFEFYNGQATIQITWLDSNKRIRNVEWTVATGAIQATITREDVQPPAVVYDRIIQGPASGSENVPGSWTMQEETDPEYPEEGPQLKWPTGIRLEIRQVG